MADLNFTGNKYHRRIFGLKAHGQQFDSVVVDVYAVESAFEVTNPGAQHCLKKVLCGGLRGKADKLTDLREARDALTRAIEDAEREVGEAAVVPTPTFDRREAAPAVTAPRGPAPALPPPTPAAAGWDFDVAPYLHPEDPWPASGDVTLEQIRQTYALKYRVARLLAPDSILEIGVRAGYSATAFLAARPTARYVGLDNNGDAHGGVPGFPPWAADRLRERFPAAQTEVRLADTQADWPTVDELGGPFDLIHVDGDHTRAGAYGDLCLAERIGARWVLIDDVDYLPEVAAAVADFFSPRRDVRSVRLPSPRGDVLIQMPPPETP